MDYFDLAQDYGGVLANAFRGTRTRSCGLLHLGLAVPDTREPHHRARAERCGANVSFVEIETDRGHDAFLLDEPELFATVRGFLSAAARRRGVA